MKKNFKFASSKIINNNTQRNFTIDDFLPTIEYFKNKKINIIRVGSIQEFPIKKKFSYLFDYSFSKIKDDILDLYFLSNCKFYIGSDSGIGNVSVISNKLVGIINSTYYNNIMIQNFKRGVIFKKFFSKDKDRFLSLNEIFENKFHILTTFNEFYNLNIECINNTPEEIKNFANELLLRSNKNDFTYEYNQTDREYHREFWNIVKYYDKYSIVNYKNIFIGNNFLKNNLHLINA